MGAPVHMESMLTDQHPRDRSCSPLSQDGSCGARGIDRDRDHAASIRKTAAQRMVQAQWGPTTTHDSLQVTVLNVLVLDSLYSARVGVLRWILMTHRDNPSLQEPRWQVQCQCPATAVMYSTAASSIVG